jgi:hypothetical protein
LQTRKQQKIIRKRGKKTKESVKEQKKKRILEITPGNEKEGDFRYWEGKKEEKNGSE